MQAAMSSTQYAVKDFSQTKLKCDTRIKLEKFIFIIQSNAIERKMFTRQKFRKIVEIHRQEMEEEYFKKLKSQNERKSSLRSKTSRRDILKKEAFEMDQSKRHNINMKSFKTSDVATFLKMHYFNSNTETVSCEKIEPDLSHNIKDYMQLDIFHRAVRPIFLLGQCFAIMPVVGIFNPNPRHMYFSYKSIQMLVTATYLASNGWLLISVTRHLSKIGINAKNFVGLVFFFCVQSACALFLYLAKRWPSIIQSWTRIELIFTRPPYEEPKRNLRKRVRFAAYVIILCSIFEHALFNISEVISYTRKIHICAEARNESGIVSFDDYIQSNYEYVFGVLSYRRIVAVFVLMINGASTFIWNYMDLFIMIISKGIAYRFEQIMMRINKIADQDVSEQVFIEIRIHYVKVCELLDSIDEHLSGIILLSCINNLYFVCNQLLNIFNKLRWPINYIYFWYSLIYLIVRTAFVFLTAASINDESKSALTVLRAVSHKSWCDEVERLIFQMTTQTVALSGKKFYFLTRRLLFGMAGTIVTYELVLLQFDEPNRTQGLPPLCS